MIKKRSPNQFFPIVLLMFLVACGNQNVVLPTETPIPTSASPTLIPTSTLVAVTIIPSPLPTRPTVPIITPDSIQLERWIEYEEALKQNILPTWSFESLHCEWDILARAGQEVYVWALCGSSKGTDMRPAVIHLRANGSIRNVEILRLGHPSDIDRLFPKEAQAKFSFYQGMSAFDGRLKEMLDHLYYRETHPEEPPLVILSALPTLTPVAVQLSSPSPLPSTETSVPITQSSLIPASGIPTTGSLDNEPTWTECVLPRQDYAYSTDMEFVTDCLKRDQPSLDEKDKQLQGERIHRELGDNLRLVVGKDIYETRYSRSAIGADYELLKNGEVTAKTGASWTTFDPNINLWNIGGKVIWEIANPSVLIVDGLNQNEKYQFEGSYFPYEIQHKLIYIAKKNGKYHVVYDGKIIGPEFDWIYLGYCCGNTIVLRGQGQYWFWGKREGTSFVVAIY